MQSQRIVVSAVLLLSWTVCKTGCCIAVFNVENMCLIVDGRSLKLQSAVLYTDRIDVHTCV